MKEIKFYVRQAFPGGLWYAVDEDYESEMIYGIVIASGFVGIGDTIHEALIDLLDKQQKELVTRTEKFSCYKFAVIKDTNGVGFSYEIYTDIRVSNEWFETAQEARFAAIGHISLLENERI